MRKLFKLIVIILMIFGITLSVLNFISVDNMALRSAQGSMDSGDCAGEPLNC
jgi:hypothetical protein